MYLSQPKSRTVTANTLKIDSCSSHCTTPTERPDPQLVSVKVGFLHINPASARGRRLYMIQMLVLSFLPHAALIMQNCTIMAQLSTTMDSALYLNTEVRTSLSLGETVTAIQEERMASAMILYWEGTSYTENEPDRSEMQRVYLKTTTFLNEIPDKLMTERRRAILYQLREDIIKYRTATTGGRQLFARMKIYDEINSEILILIARQVKSTTSSLWRQLSAYYELLKSIEDFTLTVTANAILLTLKESDVPTLAAFQKHQTSALEHLQFAIQYLEAEGLIDDYPDLTHVETIYRDVLFVKTDIENATQTIEDITVQNGNEKLLLDAKNCIRKLRGVQTKIWDIVRESVKEEVWVARRTLTVGIVILVLVLLASPVLILLLRHTVVTIQTFTKSIELSTQRLIAEKQKSDYLLSRMLPMPVLKRLRAQRSVPAEAFEAVTIFFSDIVGFTNISASSTPMEVINMLNMLYNLFDEKIQNYNVYKVETIGDAYMVVSGLPERNGNRHASEIADMSLSLMRSLDGAKVPHRPDEPLRIRAGANTGPCVAGVVGTTMPRYCLFGDTINTASRMESTGEAMKIHISVTTKTALEEIGGYEIQPRDPIDIAGKGKMETYWLLGKSGEFEIESPRCLKLRDYDETVMELLINS